MYKIITIVGARPQFIKAAALSRAIRSHSAINEILIHTGQHFDSNMSDVFFEEMEIPPPNYQLQIAGLNHGAMTGRMMSEIEEVVLKESPSAILVYGDTNSTLAGSLVAAKLHIPVIHVEAGLRSFNMNMPEEVNRILTDRISSLLLCPTQQSLLNLKNEGYEHFNIQVELVGDIMEDTSLFYKNNAIAKSKILDTLKLTSGYVLLTCHRAENTSDKFRMLEIIKGVNSLAIDRKIVWPVHPRLKESIQRFELNENIILIEPVGYFDMINLIINSEIVLTDSGGLQKEAYFFNKFCITMRDQTEWIELVENDFNFLVGADGNRIIEVFNKLKGKVFEKNIQLYGGGKSSEKMANIIYKFLQKIN
jgi:UDP-GlcNAc3NAcA epimerase